MRQGSESEVVARLFAKPPRRFRVSLLWLMIFAAVAPAGIYAVYLATPVVIGNFLPELPPERLRYLSATAMNRSRNSNAMPPDLLAEWDKFTELQLWQTSFPIAVILFIVVTVTAGFGVVQLPCGVRKYAVTIATTTCAAIVITVIVLWIGGGIGDTSVLAATSMDYLVVYGGPLAAGVASGVLLGGLIGDA